MVEEYNLTAAKAFYGITYSASAVVYPFLMIYFKLCGFNQRQIGVLFAVRPWLTLVMGNFWAGVADYMHIHRPLFLTCYIVASLFRFSICLVDTFIPALAICIATELFSPPVGILMDASTMAASAAIPGGYGKIRMWGAIGWGGVSPIGGWIVTCYGMRVGFYGYLGMVAIGLIPAMLAPIQVLTHRCKEAQQAKQARLDSAQRYTPLDSRDGSTAPVKPTFIAVDALAHAQHPETPHPDQLAGVTEPVSATQHDLLRPALMQNGQQSPKAPSMKQSQHHTAAHADKACGHEQQSVGIGSEKPEVESDSSVQNVGRGSAGVVRSWPSSSNLVRESTTAAGKSQAAAAALGLAGTSDHSRHVAARASRGSSSTQEADTPTAAGAGTQLHSAYTSPYSHSRHSLDDDRGGIDPHLALQWAALEQLPLASEPVLQAFTPHVMYSPKSRGPSLEYSGFEAALLHNHCSEDGPQTALLEPEHNPADDLSALQRVSAVLRQPEVAIFLVMAVMFGYGMGTIDSFMFIYLRSLGGTEFLMGLCIFTMCATEAPLFHFAGTIFDFVGLSLTLHIVMGVYIFRLCLYGCMALAGTPWAVLPIEVLHGVTFGCAWAAGTLNCAKIAPRGLEATTQAIFNGMYMGVGLGSGGVIGGIVYDRYGARTVFFSAAGVISVGWLVVFSAQLVLRWRPKHNTNEDNCLQERLVM